MRCTTYFTVTGIDFIADDFSNAVALTPTHTWKRGDSRGRTAATYAHGGWSYSQQSEGGVIDVGQALHSMLNVIEPFSSEIKRAVARLALDAELACMVFTEGEQMPIVHFDRQLLNRVAALGVEIDVDVILTPEPHAK